ncbi:GntR family transcriptional regulator [Ktedonobacter sp. SOSP1-85]|uniref:MocR-like pyridoxine biosynthesis transcription factor PdxR n=1 Tax=Ktedonobacter sp. SOSP1-85 TaxID=2778367 RepID=UPI001916A0F1|nr:PLP-dependent aminotransferase family protein [Ktedonobacter sp. SOSP1-85]GHO80111.1 GntR family transcriptional regulator [Ktedonobacter sp. SOSP1-85]
MSKRAIPGKRIEISLDQNASISLYKQLYERLRSGILTGQLEAGMRLPSMRVLSSELGVSRSTTALAYEMLLLEGYIESRVGDGTRVAHLQSEQSFIGDQHTTDSSETPQAVLARRGQLLIKGSSSEEFFTDRANRGTSVFRSGQPDVAAFPYEVWARLVAKHARHSLQAVSCYQDAQGYAPLREVIAAHIGITRGVHCSPEQIILTAGAQGALDLVARVLLDPGDLAWVEDPGYEGARGALLVAGAKLVPVPVDREGIDVESGRQLCPKARLAIVTPSHQFPTGVTMSLSRRLALLEWARETQAWIIEDDYDSEYRFSGRPLEALQGLDNARRVIYIGTFSKVLFPSLRLGYLVIPTELLKGLIATRRIIDRYLPLLEQLALADFIAEGHFARHLRKMRGLYRERRNALIEALTQEFGEMLDIIVPEAGMHLVAWLPEGMSAQRAVQQASAHGLHLLPLSQPSQRPFQRDGLLFGFASASPEELRAGVKTLALALGKM